MHRKPVHVEELIIRLKSLISGCLKETQDVRLQARQDRDRELSVGLQRVDIDDVLLTSLRRAPASNSRAMQRTNKYHALRVSSAAGL
jgi:hypothetical protein